MAHLPPLEMIVGADESYEPNPADISVGPEMKLGVLTAIFGTPFFFWLIIRIRTMAP